MLFIRVWHSLILMLLDVFLKAWYSVYDYNTAAGSTDSTSARVGFATAK